VAGPVGSAGARALGRCGPAGARARPRVAA
jgi:hypothetical protein